ncbi:hypothetical protein [Myxococcus eversor]|uniref:hypothetical protein n=1 Tax=Myxococcus eversor TaxID=2709661 RepID=UPI0013D81D2B|nr:hypothetical protein [Myxococcus eversor]
MDEARRAPARALRLGRGCQEALAILFLLRSSTLASVGLFFSRAVAESFHAVVSGAPFVGHAGGYEVALLRCLVISVLLLIVGPGCFPVVAWLRKTLAGA